VSSSRLRSATVASVLATTSLARPRLGARAPSTRELGSGAIGISLPPWPWLHRQSVRPLAPHLHGGLSETQQADPLRDGQVMGSDGQDRAARSKSFLRQPSSGQEFLREQGGAGETGQNRHAPRQAHGTGGQERRDGGPRPRPNGEEAGRREGAGWGGALKKLGGPP
jgi:hypothetical protein